MYYALSIFSKDKCLERENLHKYRMRIRNQMILVQHQRKKMLSKRMKIRESSNDQKVIYEKSRQKSISIAKSKINKSNRKVFSQNELANE